MQELDSNHCAFVVVLGPVTKHPKADRLALTNIYGCNVIVGIDQKEGDKGVYFQSELELSTGFAQANDLVRRVDENGNKAGGMFDENRRVRAQKLRGVVSDGFFIGLESLSKAGVKSIPEVNEPFQVTDGVNICQKYTPKVTKKGVQGPQKQGPAKKKAELEKVFKQHFSTTQLRFKADFIDETKYVIITEKLEGTSGRSNYASVPAPFKLNKFQLWVMRLINPVFGGLKTTSVVTEDLHSIGSRRVIINPNNTSGAFHDPSLREIADKPFKGKLHLGETVYYEIVGYEPNGAAIMGTRDNAKLGKKFMKTYGKTTVFKYGCKDKQSKIFVYRITMTNSDGISIDLPWDALEARCLELNVNTVPVLYKGTLVAVMDHARKKGPAIMDVVSQYCGGPSTVDPTHIREGACLRIEGKATPTIYKHKNDEYKVLAGINSPDAVVVDEDALDEQ